MFASTPADLPDPLDDPSGDHCLRGPEISDRLSDRSMVLPHGTPGDADGTVETTPVFRR